MPSNKNLEQRLRMQLLRDKATLQTKKSSKQTALDISTDPKESAARRAEFRAKYEKLVKEISDLEDKIDSNTKERNKVQAKKSLAQYDEVEGQQKIADIKEQYGLLAEAYKLDQDPGIKEKIDILIQDYKDISTSVIGRPISLAAARSALTGSAPTFGTPTGTTPAPAALGGPTGTPAQPPKVKTGGTTGGTDGGKASGPTGGSGTPAGAYTAQQAKDLANTVGGTNYFAAKYGSASGPSGPSGAASSYDALLAKVKADYNLPDIIFSNVDSLGKILARYVNGEIDIDRFRQDVENDTWYRQNSKEIKARYLQKFNYADLVKSGNAQGTTDYEQSIAKITRDVQAQARKVGSAIDEAEAKLIAEDLYIHNQDADTAVVTRRVAN